MSKLLLIVDPQYDFMEGGKLPVDGGLDKMTKLASYLENNAKDYSSVVITVDSHPLNHCSFENNGGVWPTHCIAHSHGGAIFTPILEAVRNSDIKNILILEKGNLWDKEEYSIMCNELNGGILLKHIMSEKFDEIDVCGIAGDVCVANTIQDLCGLNLGEKIKVLLPFTASIDGGTVINDLIEKENLMSFE